MVAFLADECFPGPLLRELRAAGFDVLRSADVIPAAADDDVLALAFTQGRVLLTEDNDFGDLTVRLGLPARGLVRVDLNGLPKPARAARLVEALSTLGDQVLGALVTVEPRRTRLRKLMPPY